MLHIHVISKIRHPNLQLIVDSVISKCTSNRLRCRLLHEPKLDLKTLLEISFITESAEQQATEMEKHEEHNINKVTKDDFKSQWL